MCNVQEVWGCKSIFLCNNCVTADKSFMLYATTARFTPRGLSCWYTSQLLTVYETFVKKIQFLNSSIWKCTALTKSICKGNIFAHCTISVNFDDRALQVYFENLLTEAKTLETHNYCILHDFRFSKAVIMKFTIVWEAISKWKINRKIVNSLLPLLIRLSSQFTYFNPLNAELNPICHLLALLGTHHTLHISRIRVKPNVYKTTLFTNNPIGLWLRVMQMPSFLQVHLFRSSITVDQSTTFPHLPNIPVCLGHYFSGPYSLKLKILGFNDR